MAENINVVADYKGTFRQGDTATLFLKITAFNGMPIDPSSIECTITGPSETESISTIDSSGTPFNADQGFYIYEWGISDTTPTGTYSVDWEYVIDGEEGHEYQSFVVTDGDIAEPAAYSARVMAFRAALEHHICCAQSIPVYYEQSKPSYDNTSYSFTFKNWNQSAGAKIYRNGKLVSSGLEVDYFNGKITFNDALLEQETINVDYNFRWFTDDDLTRFLNNAVQTVNLYPPASGYSLDNVPDRFIPIVLYGAAKDALRQLMFCLMYQQPQQVFGGPDASQKAFQSFEALKQNYEKDWEKLLEQKKYGPYPSSRAIVTPEYTLPGGRSRWFRYLFKG